MLTLYGIPNCDTVKQARKWLDAEGIAYQFHDFRQDGLDTARLTRWIKRLGWEALLNRRSTSWRQLSEQQRKNLDEHQAIDLMLTTPTLIRRPVLEGADTLLVGFSQDNYLKSFK